MEDSERSRETKRRQGFGRLQGNTQRGRFVRLGMHRNGCNRQVNCRRSAKLGGVGSARSTHGQARAADSGSKLPHSTGSARLCVGGRRGSRRVCAAGRLCEADGGQVAEFCAGHDVSCPYEARSEGEKQRREAKARRRREVKARGEGERQRREAKARGKGERQRREAKAGPKGLRSEDLS